MHHGILNVYKERGYTSHDVVAKLRGITGQKKIGHTGTLDPDAAGVLPVCLGKATRLCEALTDHDKTYEAVLLLGTQTDTQDATGAVIRMQPVRVSKEQVRSVMQSFVGEISQVPPMYSAIKIDGKRLYELARKGVTVERQARTVTIHALQIEEIALPKVRFTVTCSKGTYIRTLCADIGTKLHCGGCMESLVRTRVGQFTAADSLTLAQIAALVAKGRLEEALLPIDGFFADLPAVYVRAQEDVRAHNGNPTAAVPLFSDRPVRLYDSAGCFVGVFLYDEPRKVYCPVKMFYGE